MGDAGKSRAAAKDYNHAKLSSVSPLQRKMPEHSHDGPLRSKQALSGLQLKTMNTSNANAHSWKEKIPKRATIAAPAIEASPPQAEVVISPELCRKRRRVSTVEDEQELAISTEASTQHQHSITVNAFREVVAQKRAKLMLTSTESQIVKMEVDNQTEETDDEGT